MAVSNTERQTLLHLFADLRVADTRDGMDWMVSQTALGAVYRRKRAQIGGPKAITATAHKIAGIFYHMWKTGEQYAEMGADYYEQKY